MKRRNFYNAAIVAAAAAVVVAPMNVSEVVASSSKQETKKVIFKDVKADTELGKAIYWMVERGVINGYPDGTFKPNETITYGQVAKILAKTMNFEYDEIHVPDYEDIDKTNPNYPYIAALHNTGIFQGKSRTEFGEKTQLKRIKMADILWRAYDLKGEGKSHFTDVKDSNNARLAMLLYENDITEGITSTEFGPNKPVTRGQLCTFIYRAEQKLAKGEIVRDGPIVNLNLVPDFELVKYTYANGQPVNPSEYGVYNLYGSTRLLIHEPKQPGRFIAVQKKNDWTVSDGIVTHYRNNQYHSDTGPLLDSRVYTIPYESIITKLEGRDAIGLKIVAIDPINAMKAYPKHVVTFTNAQQDEDGIRFDITNEGQTVVQFKYEINGKIKTKNVHFYVYEIGNYYMANIDNSTPVETVQ